MAERGDGAPGRRAEVLDDAAIGQGAQRLTFIVSIFLSLLAVAGTALDKVPLRVPVLLLALALVAVLTALANAVVRNPSPESLRKKHDARLWRLLNAWPPRTVSDVSPYHIGVRSPVAAVSDADGKPRYIKRDLESEDGGLADAVATEKVVLLLGPPVAGKSHTAWRALADCARTQGAVILVPDDAASLQEVLRSPRCVLHPDKTYVLWLDDLERYLHGLRLRELDRFMAAAHLTGTDPEGSVSLMATMREDEFMRILDEGGDKAHVLRGLDARAERFRLPGTLSPGERQRVGEHYPGAAKTDDVAEIFFAAVATSGHGRVPRATTTPPTRDVDAKPHDSVWVRAWRRLRSLNATSSWVAPGFWMTLVLLAAIGVLGATGGLLEGPEPSPPPSLAERFEALAAQDDPCGGVSVSPRDAAHVRSDLVRITHKADGCPAESDAVEIFAKHGRALSGTPAASFGLASSGYGFRCIGPDPEDPCHVDLMGGKRVILGMWKNPVTRTNVPVALYARSNDQYEPAAVSLTPPDAAVAKGSRAAVSFSAPSRITVKDGRSQRAWPLGGSPVSVAAIVSPRGDAGAVLVSGYVVGGTVAAPQILARGFELGHLQGRIIVKSACDGTAGHDLLTTVVDATGIDSALRRLWSRAVGTSRIRCQQLYAG